MSVSLLSKIVPARRRGFSLMEMLVVVTVVALLAALLIPALGKARDRARTARCMSNLKQIGHAEDLYALDNSGYMAPKKLDAQVAAGWPAYNGRLTAWWCDQIFLGQYVGSSNGDNLNPAFIDRGAKRGSALICPADFFQDTNRDVLTPSYGMGPNFTWLKAATGYSTMFKSLKFTNPSTEMVVVDGVYPEFWPGGFKDPYAFIGTPDSVPIDQRNWASDGEADSMYNWARRHNGGGGNVLFVDGHVAFFPDLKPAYDNKEIVIHNLNE